MMIWLVVTGTMEFYDFPIILGMYVIIPTDFHSIMFQRGRLKPATRKVLNRIESIREYS